MENKKKVKVNQEKVFKCECGHCDFSLKINPHPTKNSHVEVNFIQKKTVVYRVDIARAELTEFFK